jgi:hypothetical protein
MPYRTIMNAIGGAARTVTEFYEDVTETVRSITPEPIGQALDALAGTVERAVSKTPIGVAERGAAATGDIVGQASGNKALGQAVGFGLGLAVPGPEVSRAAKPVIPKGVKPSKPQAPVIDTMMPPGLAPAMAGVAPTPSIQPTFEKGGLVMKAVTAKDPESLRLAGVKTGQDIVSPDEAKQLTKRALKVQHHVDKLDSLESTLMDSLESGADAYTIKRLRANIKKERPKLYSARSNVSVPTKEDPLYYGTAAARRDRDALALSKGVTEALEEHHLFPKVVSGAFFAKMDEFIKAGKAELDDLLLMNRVAIAKGRKPGDYKSGMYILEKAPHNEYHTIMKEAGDEFKVNQAESWAKIVDEAKDVDDLLVLWRGTLDDLVVPTAEDIQSYDKLDALLKEVRSLP